MSTVVSRYERAIVEHMVVGGQRVARIRPVDGAGILAEDGRPLPCWNALSAEQQRSLIHDGGRVRHAEGDGCDQPAAVLVEAPNDEDGPGPRFYCYGCAADYTARLAEAAR